MNISGLKNICLTSWQTHHCCWQVQIICKINGISTALLQLYNFIWNLKLVTCSAAFKIKRLRGLALRRPPVAQGYSVQLGQGWEGELGRAVTVSQCPGVPARQFSHREDGMWVLSSVPAQPQDTRHRKMLPEAIPLQGTNHRRGSSWGLCRVSDKVAA